MRRMEVTHTVVPRARTLRLKCYVDSLKTGYELYRSVFITDGGILESTGGADKKKLQL